MSIVIVFLLVFWIGWIGDVLVRKVDCFFEMHYCPDIRENMHSVPAEETMKKDTCEKKTG